MDHIDTLLRRPGLAPRLRLLVLFKACIWPADIDLEARLIRLAQPTGVSRSELEEAVLQATLFYGFPRAVTAFEVLNREWPVTAPPSGGALPPEEQETVGKRLFAQIYGRNDQPVRKMLMSFHSEFHDFVLSAAYGRILTRPGLTPKTRELMAVGALAVMEQVPQLVGHARGAKHFGATDEEVRETVFTVTLDDELALKTVRRVGGQPS